MYCNQVLKLTLANPPNAGKKSAVAGNAVKSLANLVGYFL